MKILFVSDIHGVKTNLSIIEKYSYDTIIFLGDIYHRGYTDNGEIDNDYISNFIIKNRSKAICLLGNCDLEMDYINLSVPLNKDFIKFYVGEKLIYCSHGHKYNKYNYSFLESADLVIYGHEHYPYIEKINSTIYSCVGSISNPRGDSLPSFAILTENEYCVYSIYGDVIQKIKI